MRALNQDCVAVGDWIAQEDMQRARLFSQSLQKPFVCLVADGLGGHPAGELASRLAAEALARLLAVAAQDQIAAAIRQVNAYFYEVMREHPRCATMGTTVCGLVAGVERIAVFNVGDSRVYGVTGRGLRQLTVDDSEEPQWDRASFLPRSGALTQAIGGAWRFTDVEPHLHLEPCEPGGRYLLCSDGLYDALALEEIARLLGGDLAASVEALFGAAMDAFARDNVSIALVRICGKAAP